MKLLSQITNHACLSKLTSEQRITLCEELRNTIIGVVNENGGHLASNLGVIELTVALYTVFDPMQDKVVWDVGHQTYAHKLLTGRFTEFASLRKQDGLSGFPQMIESNADSFVAGHASNSISAALGYARARDLFAQHFHVIAVIGDGALTGGMAYEALCDAGQSDSNIIVVLNDNAMSISDNVGGVSTMLSRMRMRPGYLRFKRRVKKALVRIPLVGKPLFSFVFKVREKVKFFILPRYFFEEIGFTYLGPLEGHDVEELIEVFKDAAQYGRPLLIHIRTIKGKGCPEAELDPIHFHSISPSGKMSTDSNSAIVGRTLLQMAEHDPSIVAVTAAMMIGTGLECFKKKYPNRIFDVGIAEQHAVTLAAGMAAGGLRPYAAIYSTFLQRAYDQIVQDVCLPCLPVCFCIDRAGLVGEDGVTHNGLLDISMLNVMPNIRIYAPSSQGELISAICHTREINAPSAVRYPRGLLRDNMQRPFVDGWQIIHNGESLCIVSNGRLLEVAERIERLFANTGEKVGIINAARIKPIEPRQMALLSDYRNIVVLEEGMETGGFGATVSQLINKTTSANTLTIGVPDVFVQHATVKEQFLRLGWDEQSLFRKICAWREDLLRVKKN